VLAEKKEIKELESEEEKEQSRFESILNIVKSMRGSGENSEETPNEN
jgi:hypothetical protein